DLMGSPLPRTRFIGPDGGIVDLADFRGAKSVVLVVLRGFAGQVCIACSAQTAALASHAKDFEARGAQVALVYPGRAETVPAFLDAVADLDGEFALPFPVLLDVNLGAVNALAIKGALA